MPETTKKLDDNRVIALLSYIGILVLVPLLTAKEDEFVKFHAKQGLVLLVAAIAVGMVGVIPLLGWLIAFVGGLTCLALAVMGIVNVLNGKKKPLPLIGQFADKFNI
ncbi:MAG: hypothetical protein PHR64_00080 [Candidatus Shapirobacteria bacterium]|nr:hypothetical protein [Candidatus Shapirobacteria bacterium]MDD5073583.1 hypothetical protein [Candidatus Shapirobacteria bacterium]MDD5481336.1 hypothetical protein [Candidatus Shapirobacteria bacterium]